MSAAEKRYFYKCIRGAYVTGGGDGRGAFSVARVRPGGIMSSSAAAVVVVGDGNLGGKRRACTGRETGRRLPPV